MGQQQQEQTHEGETMNNQKLEPGLKGEGTMFDATPHTPPFEEFQKIARLSRDCIITEKLDGTNAQIYIPEHGAPMLVGSRNRYITPDADNFGFARWAWDHEAELREGLGVGRHFGEWWGAGIQRRYGLIGKRFSLFNVARWIDRHERYNDDDITEKRGLAPLCCSVVPVLYRGIFTTDAVEGCITRLREVGSHASPGFMNPEGVVVWHESARQLFKKTLLKDEAPKSLSERVSA